MFLQILYAVVKGLMEMDGFVLQHPTPPSAKPSSADCCTGTTTGQQPLK